LFQRPLEHVEKFLSKNTNINRNHPMNQVMTSRFHQIPSLKRKTRWWFQVMVSKIFVFTPKHRERWSNLTGIFFRWVGSTATRRSSQLKIWYNSKMKSPSFWGGGIDLMFSGYLFGVIFGECNFPLRTAQVDVHGQRGWWFGIPGDPIGIQTNPNHQLYNHWLKGALKNWIFSPSFFLWYLPVAKKQKLVQVTPKWWLSSFRFWNYSCVVVSKIF